MSEYEWAYPYIDGSIATVVEVGSRDGLDAIDLARHFNASVVAFEADPENYTVTTRNVEASGLSIEVMPVALTDMDGTIDFYPVDTELLDNPGASSQFQLNFSNRPPSDPNKGREPVQRHITVPGARFDSLGRAAPDLLVMDVQGGELLVLEGFGRLLSDVDWICLEVERVSSYHGGTTFREVDRKLRTAGFHFVASDLAGRYRWRLWLRGLKVVLSRVKRREFAAVRRSVYSGHFNVLYRR